ncbi:hypothetical protein FIBSPDRAFT_850763 [Athelia psychrophila]|uniref:Uncharacterized protein n=1 Tax=Athelia psychrophila TaxID=1759441 RepID=A0A166T0N8_9AGAM|nr:hypothetical protein FIBSPDRAFT_850763 [Fibularhizoctonia sp. CBS 109695]
MVFPSVNRDISTPHTPPTSGLDKRHASLSRLPALPDIHIPDLLPLRLCPLLLLRARILHVLQPRVPPVRLHINMLGKHAHDHELGAVTRFSSLSFNRTSFSAALRKVDNGLWEEFWTSMGVVASGGARAALCLSEFALAVHV